MAIKEIAQAIGRSTHAVSAARLAGCARRADTDGDGVEFCAAGERNGVDAMKWHSHSPKANLSIAGGGRLSGVECRGPVRPLQRLGLLVPILCGAKL